MNILRNIFLFVFLWLGACSNLQRTPVVPYSVVIDDPQRLRFQGKGAAAGMMMSSSMGPMGIAIGVAIDEGIAKDLQLALDRSGCRLDSLVDRAFEQALSRHNHLAIKESPASPSKEVVTIQIRRIGFIVLPGEVDNVFAEIKAQLIYRGGQQDLDFPPEAERAEYSAALELLKNNGQLSCELLQKALSESFADGYQRFF
jgi:hypothetical protein